MPVELKIKVKTTSGTEMGYIANSGLTQQPMEGTPVELSIDYLQRLQNLIDTAKSWFTLDDNIKSIEVERR